MSKVKQEMETRCELAMMGKVVEVHDNGEARMMTRYILQVLTDMDDDTLDDFDIIGDHINKYCINKVDYLVVNTVQDMRCITFLLENAEVEGDEYPKPFEEDFGSGYPCAFCYVLNLDVPDFSEFGDCFFEKKSDGFYHRVS